jgi:3-dehydroquinate dehydratase-1
MMNRPADIHNEMRTRPLIVASLTGNGPAVPSAKKAREAGADLLEVRIDTLPPNERASITDILSEIREAVPLPLIATVRSPHEQGAKQGVFKLDEDERASIFEKAMPFVEFADVELRASSINAAIIKLARQAGKKVILSYHDFESTPSETKIQKLIEEFKTLSGDILKVAAMPQSPPDVAKLLSLCASLNEVDRVFISMGELGRISRVAGFAFGSCLTYGHVGEAVAPGQISVQELARLCDLFYSSNR